MPSKSPADWQLPPGVNRGLWEYFHNAAIADGYDAGLADSPLVQQDLDFVRRHCAPGSRLLDLGCGSGRLATALGMTCGLLVGIDFSVEMLRVARAKAPAVGKTAHWLQGNIVELDFLVGDQFDLAACLFSTLGMVRTAAARRRVLEHAHRLLRPGGRLVLHVHNRWHNLRHAGGRTWICRQLLGLAARKERWDWPMAAHAWGAGLVLHLYSRREITNLLNNVGFRVLEIECVPDGTRPTCWHNWRCQGYLVAAEKPA